MKGVGVMAASNSVIARQRRWAKQQTETFRQILPGFIRLEVREDSEGPLFVIWLKKGASVRKRQRSARNSSIALWPLPKSLGHHRFKIERV